MRLSEDTWMSTPPTRFVSAFAPFPRSIWVNPQVPRDNFDRVCKIIWSRAKEAEKESGNKSSHRAEEQQKEKADVGLSTHYEDKQQQHTEFILPCPYLSGQRHPHVAKPASVLSSVMEVEMKEAERKRNLEKDTQRSVKNSQPLAKNPTCSAPEEHTLHLLDEEDLPLPSKLRRDTCESENEQETRSSYDSTSCDDDDVTLPEVRDCATDSTDDSLTNGKNGSEVQKSEILQSSDELSSDSEQDSSFSGTEKDFPPLSAIRAGILPCPVESPALRKMHGQWEIPLSFHPHDNPTATLASTVTVPVKALIQGKAETPQANSKTNAPPEAPTHQGVYDLLADFPALQPPKRPLALSVLHDGNPKTKDAKGSRGLTHSPNHRQESGASQQKRMENVPHGLSSICAGDQKSVLDLQTFGSASQHNSPTISCKDPKANNQLPPRISGADGVDVNVRSWASAAKAGMKKAAAPQEKTRPCTSQQIVTINKVKARYSVAQNFTDKVSPSQQRPSSLVTGLYPGPQPRHPNQFVRPAYPPAHQHFGAQPQRASCPSGFRCPRFPFQQASGNLSKHSHM